MDIFLVPKGSSSSTWSFPLAQRGFRSTFSLWGRNPETIRLRTSAAEPSCQITTRPKAIWGWQHSPALESGRPASWWEQQAHKQTWCFVSAGWANSRHKLPPLVGKHNVFAFKYSSKSKIKMNVRNRSDQCIKSLNKLLSLISATAQRREAKCAVSESVQATGRRQS